MHLKGFAEGSSNAIFDEASGRSVPVAEYIAIFLS